MGYLDGTAYTARRKTNEEMRNISIQVANGLAGKIFRHPLNSLMLS